MKIRNFALPALLAVSLWPACALAAPPPAIRESVAVCDPNAPSHCLFSTLSGINSTATESSHVLKSSAGTLYSVYVTPQATAGYLMLFDATSAPADGAVTPKECIGVAASTTNGISFSGVPAGPYATGIVAVFSTTGCFTKTASATAFFKAVVQ